MNDDSHYQTLLVAHLEGELPPQESRELLEHLRTNPGRLEELAQSIALDRLLDLAAEPELEASHFSAEVALRIQTAPQADAFARSVRHRLKPRRPFLFRAALPIAATIALLAVASVFLKRESSLARIASSSDLVWPADQALSPQAELVEGQTVKIESGLLTLEFPGRGLAVLEGPAELTIVERKLFALAHGRATFTVTPGGKGLTVDTPHGRVVDLGTAFALDVSEQAADLHVLQGSVEFSSPQDAPRKLLAGDALRAGESAAAPIPFAGTNFVQSLPPRGKAPDSYAFWSCREGHGPSSKAEGKATNAPLFLKAAAPQNASPIWQTIDGRSGLTFDGRNAYAQTTYPGLLGDTPRTVALWVRVPAAWTAEDAGALLSWGRFEWREPSVLFELTLNRDPSRGPLGAPQLDTFGSMATAQISLCDDQWHHLAVTSHQGADDSPTSQILFYLDGHLLASSPRALPRLDTVASGGRTGILVGRSAQSIRSDPAPEAAFFRGSLSDLLLFPQAMNASQIQNLMHSGTP